MSAKKHAVIGLATTELQAHGIVEALQTAGFPLDGISVLLPDRKGSREFAHENNTKAPEGAIAGASAGGALGGALGLLAGIGALAIPGLGIFIAAGPLMALLGGAATGAAIGGVAGALIGMGIPEVEAKLYEGKLKEGHILMSVHVDTADQRKNAERLLAQGGAQHIVIVGESPVPKKQKQQEKDVRHV